MKWGEYHTLPSCSWRWTLLSIGVTSRSLCVIKARCCGVARTLEFKLLGGGLSSQEVAELSLCPWTGGLSCDLLGERVRPLRTGTGQLFAQQGSLEDSIKWLRWSR